MKPESMTKKQSHQDCQPGKRSRREQTNRRHGAGNDAPTAACNPTLPTMNMTIPTGTPIRELGAVTLVPEVFGEQEAADYLRIELRTLRHWRRTRGVPTCA